MALPWSAIKLDKSKVNREGSFFTGPKKGYNLEKNLVYKTLSIPNRKKWGAEILRECSHV